MNVVNMPWCKVFEVELIAREISDFWIGRFPKVVFRCSFRPSAAWTGLSGHQTGETAL